MVIKYERPSGSEIEVSDTPANRAAAESLGWTEVKPKPKQKAATKRS